MATSKMSRQGADDDVIETESTGFFDFGEPEVMPVEVTAGKFLYLKEPCAEDLMHIAEINNNSKLSEIEATLQTICVLHSPQNGDKKLSMRDAKKLTARQLKKIGEAMGQLLGADE